MESGIEDTEMFQYVRNRQRFLSAAHQAHSFLKRLPDARSPLREDGAESARWTLEVTAGLNPRNGRSGYIPAHLTSKSALT